MNEKEVYEICRGVDSFIARELTESILHRASYETLEACHGILPVSKSGFYRKQRTVRRIIRQRTGEIREEPTGQMQMVWEREE